MIDRMPRSSNVHQLCASMTNIRTLPILRDESPRAGFASRFVAYHHLRLLQIRLKVRKLMVARSRRSLAADDSDFGEGGDCLRSKLVSNQVSYMCQESLQQIHGSNEVLRTTRCVPLLKTKRMKPPFDEGFILNTRALSPGCAEIT